MTEIPLSLYIHIPWCEKKCPYCDFNSHMTHSDVDEAAYIETLLHDLQSDIAQFKTTITDREIQTLFIGGGTPSLFSAQSYADLFKGLREQLRFSADIEVTLEANPGSSEVDKFSGFKQAGINRLSIGIQSFNQQHLLALGRVHSSSEALNAASYAKQAGFNNFNLDLMFGLPKQSLMQSIDDVQQAIALEPNHLSFYQLTIEPNTLFHHQPPARPNDEALWDMQTQLQTELAKNRYQQYEVSAYAKPNYQCRHNLNYWQYGDYLGIGAGAHAKLTNSSGTITRLWKTKHPTTYLNKESKIGGIEVVDSKQVAFEFMMNALRLNQGFNVSLFEQRTALTITAIEKQLANHEATGLMQIRDNHITPTTRGKQMLDSMLQDYLPG